MKCSQCVFFKKVVDLSNVASTTGMCYRYPPKPFPIPQQGGGIGVIAARPSTDANEFCGEFKVAPESMKATAKK